MVKAKRSIPRTCHCGSGKLPGIMREHGWCCGECFNDFRRCPGSAQPIECGECGTTFRGEPTETPCPRCGSHDHLVPVNAQIVRTAIKATVRGMEG